MSHIYDIPAGSEIQFVEVTALSARLLLHLSQEAAHVRLRSLNQVHQGGDETELFQVFQFAQEEEEENAYLRCGRVKSSRLFHGIFHFSQQSSLALNSVI